MFADLVATRFVFLRSRLNSSFLVSKGFWQGQQSKKEILGLRGKGGTVSRRMWYLSIFDPNPLELSFIWEMCICVLITFCFHLYVCFVLSVLWPQHPLTVKEFDKLLLENISKQFYTHNKSCFCLSSFIFYTSQLLYLCSSTDAQRAWQMCVFEGGIRFLWGGKGVQA